MHIRHSSESTQEEYDFIEACVDGHLEEVKKLNTKVGLISLLSGVKYAVANGRLSVVRFLLGSGVASQVDLNWLIELAFRRSRYSIVRLLVVEYGLPVSNITGLRLKEYKKYLFKIGDLECLRDL